MVCPSLAQGVNTAAAAAVCATRDLDCPVFDDLSGLSTDWIMGNLMVSARLELPSV